MVRALRDCRCRSACTNYQGCLDLPGACAAPASGYRPCARRRVANATIALSSALIKPKSKLALCATSAAIAEKGEKFRGDVLEQRLVFAGIPC